MFYPLLLPFALFSDVLAVYQDLPLVPAAQLRCTTAYMPHFWQLHTTSAPTSPVLLLFLFLISSWPARLISWAESFPELPGCQWPSTAL